MNPQDNVSQPEVKAEKAIEWSPKREWWFNGPDFLVQVKHHIAGFDDDEGRNRWNVYAFVYPKHPHFQAFSGENMMQDACTALPLHRGPSYHRVHYDAKGAVTAHQVGCDYAHIHDERFQKSGPEDQFPNGTVFQDAQDLIQWLKIRETAEVQP